MRLVMGVFFGLAVVLGSLAREGGHFQIILNATAFAITFGGAVCALLIAYPFKSICRACILSINGQTAEKQELMTYARVFKSFGKFTVLASVVCLLIGAIHVLRNLANPAQIGPGILVGMIGVFYSALIKLLICDPVHDSFLEKCCTANASSILKDNTSSFIKGESH